MIKDSTLLAIGLLGSMVTAFFSVTPILTSLFNYAGLGALYASLDDLLLPAWTIFVGLVVIAMNNERRAQIHGTREDVESPRWSKQPLRK